jgi:hypothetical protein
MISTGVREAMRNLRRRFQSEYVEHVSEVITDVMEGDGGGNETAPSEERRIGVAF